MKKILILVMFSVSLLSCNDDFEKTPVTDASLTDSWKMETYVAFMAALPVLEEGDITWTFNANNTITVVNTVDDMYPYMLDSGTYDFTIEGDIIAVDGAGSYDYDIEGNQLTMEHVSAEVDAGPIMTFSKN